MFMEMEFRVANRVQIDGSSVIIEHLEISNPEIAHFLTNEVDPANALISLIEIAFALRSQFAGNTESRAIKAALADVESKIEEAYQTFSERFAFELDELANPQTGKIQKGLEASTSSALRKLLNPEVGVDFEPSPIARLKAQLFEQIQESIRVEIGRPLEMISRKLRVSEGERKASQAGGDFEIEIDSQIRAIAKVHGDHSDSTGSTAQVGKSKKGDTLVTLRQKDTFGQNRSIIWESKTAKEFKKTTLKSSPPIANTNAVTEELRKALDNHGADVAVMVLDNSLLDMNAQVEWHELNNSMLLLVVDEFNPSPELIRLAYIWARSKAREISNSSAAEIDQDMFMSSVKSIRANLKKITEAKKHQTAATKSIEDAKGWLDSMQTEINQSIDSLQAALNISPSETEE
jgi:hypothetical protein